MKIITINDYTIPQADIVSISTVIESLDHKGDSISGSQATITLNNVDGAYDERIYGSLFYGVDWFNSEVEIYDTDIKLTIFVGRIKKYAIDDTNRRVTLTVNDAIVEMNDIVCICSLSGKTPAEVIYTILTDPNGLNLSDNRIVKGTFDAAAAYQASLGITLEVNYLAKDNIKIFDAIRAICEYTGASIYMRDNRIVYVQRKPYTGELGMALYDKDIIVGSVRQESGDLPIYNAYEITYKSGSGVAIASGVNQSSRIKYGVLNTWVVPQSGRSSTLASDYKLLFSTQAAALAAGNLILSLYAFRRTLVQFSVSIEYADIMLGDIIIAQFKPYTNEPILVKEIQKNPEQRTIQIKGELINYYRTIELDTTPPNTPEIKGYIYNYNQQRLYIEVSNDPTVSGYYVYVSRDNSFQDIVVVQDKLSPFIAPTTTYLGKQYLYFTTPPDSYYLKITAFDQSKNISDDSQIVHIDIPGDVTSLSRRHYRCAGGLFLDYLSIDIYNQSNDTPPEHLLSYDDNPLYDAAIYTYAAVYDSDTIYNSATLTLDASPETLISYRTYTTSWSEFSQEQPVPYVLPQGIIQLRLYITPSTWSAGAQYHYRIL